MYKYRAHKPQNFFERIFGGGSPGGAPAPAASPAPAPAASTPAAAPAPAQDTDDLAKFKELWKVDPNKVDPSKAAPIFGDIDPAKLQEAAGKIDFARVLDQDTIAKISAGGQEAGSAFAAALNKVTQAAYAQSALASTKIVEQALAKQREQFEQMIPDMVKRASVSQTMRADNPLYSRPEVAPIIGALEFQLTAQYPNSTPAEISAMAKEYLQGLAKVVSPQPKSDTSDGKSGKDETDWDEFMKT